MAIKICFLLKSLYSDTYLKQKVILRFALFHANFFQLVYVTLREKQSNILLPFLFLYHFHHLYHVL